MGSLSDVGTRIVRDIIEGTDYALDPCDLIWLCIECVWLTDSVWGDQDGYLGGLPRLGDVEFSE